MRVVVDTNVFVSSFINPAGAPRKVIDLWKKGDVILCLSAEIIEEYLLVLGRLGLEGGPEMDGLLTLFKKKRNILFTSLPGTLKVVEADPADDKFIECALQTKAAFIISGDRHLLGVGTHEGIPVVTPAGFLERREAS